MWGEKMIKEFQFKAIFRHNKGACEDWLDVLNEGLAKYEVNTPPRVAMFLAQCGHESSDFRRLEENMMYSADGLRRTFPRYFGVKRMPNADDYARRPEKIANHVYDDAIRSNPLGNTKKGDGWRFRGRGLIQVTGRWNYEMLAKAFDKSGALEAVQWLETPEGSVLSALDFWKRNKLNPLADKGDVEAVTKKINGGTHGLADRVRRYRFACNALVAKEGDLFVGSFGPVVASLQKTLGITADGIFGMGTYGALLTLQETIGIKPTGSISPSEVVRMLE